MKLFIPVLALLALAAASPPPTASLVPTNGPQPTDVTDYHVASAIDNPITNNVIRKHRRQIANAGDYPIINNVVRKHRRQIVNVADYPIANNTPTDH
ncbi:hypothetical protein LPJ66_007776 [Kickxella alabastrina]|uniref:Uncharacterized protein n=1 Tax=Kickxella alabastrina TaxID=61397 RepID=A0ACC1I862_9FUNG|nr:hypothetical protein LPJ66_007776 [Kickxella alabastrina]